MKFFSGITFPIAGTGSSSYRKSKVPLYYGLQCNHSGEFNIRLDNQERRNLEGAWVFFTHPQAHFEYGPPAGQERVSSHICFFGPRVDYYIETGLLPLEKDRLFLRKITDVNNYLNLVMSFIDANNSGKFRHERLVHMFENLLLCLHEQDIHEDQVIKNYHLSISSLIEKIDSAPEKSWNFKLEAKTMGLSYPHFRRLFQRFGLNSPQQYVISQRLRKASNLLAKTDEPVKSISRLIGIENEFYFSRLFKSKYAISPVQYRSETQKL